MPNRNARKAKKTTRRAAPAPQPIEPLAVYRLAEAADRARCHYQSIRRAIQSGNLKTCAAGSRPQVLGEELLRWLRDGGKTGRSKATMGRCD
jgi:hypothetical protein